MSTNLYTQWAGSIYSTWFDSKGNNIVTHTMELTKGIYYAIAASGIVMLVVALIVGFVALNTGNPKERGSAKERIVRTFIAIAGMYALGSFILLAQSVALSF